MKILKTYESFDSILPEIKDILESNVLDNWDLDLGIFGFAKETKIINRKYPSVMYLYDLPDDMQILLNGDGESYNYNPNNYDKLVEIDFIIVEIRCMSKYFLENLEVIDSVESFVRICNSMFGLELVNLSDKYFQNSICLEEYDDIINIDWNNVSIYKKIASKFILKNVQINGVSLDDNLRIQIFLRGQDGQKKILYFNEK